MPRLSARDALRYATDDEMLKLYGVLVGGWALLFVSQLLLEAVRNPVASLVGFILFVASVFAVLFGVVAIARKLLVES